MLEADQLLAQVCGADPKLVAAALQDAHGRDGELTPGIVARIEAAAADPEAWLGADKPNVGFLLHLAAAFRAVGAHEPFTRLLRLPGKLPDELLGDVVTEDGATILADTYPGTPDALLALVDDARAGGYERNAGLLALAMLWKRGRFPREELLALMLRIAASLNPEQERDVVVGNGLVDVALHIHAVEIRGTILGLFERDLAEETFTESDYVAEILAQGMPDARESERLDSTITDAWRRVAHWYFFRKEERQLRSLPPLPETEIATRATIEDVEFAVPYRAPPKVGRNEPCPCGSGKKYKKCCGA